MAASFLRRWRMCTMTVLLDWAFASSPHTASNKSRDATGRPAARSRHARMANSLGVSASGSPWSVAAYASSSSATPRASSSWAPVARPPSAGGALRRRRARTRATSSRGLKGLTT